MKRLKTLCSECGVAGLQRAEVFAIYRNGVRGKPLDLACSDSWIM